MADVKDTVASHISTNWNAAVLGGSGAVPVVDAVSPEDIEKPEDYPEAILVYNEDVSWDRVYSQGTYGIRHTKVYILLTAHTRSGCTKTHFRAFIDELKSVFGSAISGFDLQILDPEKNLTQTRGQGMYQASFLLHLFEYGVSVSSASAGGAAGSSYWDEYFVVTQASANLTNETVLSTYLGSIPDGVDLVPANDAGIDIGTNAKRIAIIYLDDLTSAAATLTAASIGTLTITGSVTGLEDADIPDTISITDITQITNRSHTNLSDIGTNTHAQVDTHIASTSDPHSTIPDTIANVLTDHTKAAHDALACSHDSLSDVSADDHHNESHTFTSHSDITATLSGAELEDAILYLAANHDYVPCMAMPHDNYPILYNVNQWRFANAANPSYVRCWLPLPPVKNGLKLYVDGIRVGIFDGDANDYISLIEVQGLAYDGDTEIDDSGAITAGNGGAELYTDTWTAHDCSGYEMVLAELTCVINTATDFKVSSVDLRCYYGE